jgi:hypothetical protein
MQTVARILQTCATLMDAQLGAAVVAEDDRRFATVSVACDELGQSVLGEPGPSRERDGTRR